MGQPGRERFGHGDGHRLGDRITLDSGNRDQQRAVLVDGTHGHGDRNQPRIMCGLSSRPGCPNVGFSYALNTAALTAGSHTITVSATDSASPLTPVHPA